MADLATTLAQTGSLLAIAGVPATAQPGQAITASLVPPLSPLRFTEIIERDISLDLIAKNVVFANDDIASPGFVEDAALVKVLPQFNLTTLPPSLDTSGTAGLIGKLKGKFPIAVPTEEAPSLSVTWQVRDEAGTVLVEGQDFLAPNGLTNPALDIVFLPAFAPFDGSIPPPAKRLLTASITLTAGAETFSRDVGPVTVTIPAIPFPKVLALTLHKNFQGAALVAVPGNSAITTVNHIKQLLQPVRNVINTLTTVARFAEMLIGIDTLSSVLEASNIAFTKANQIGDLNDIDLVGGTFNDTEAEDELSAFVYVAPPPPPESTQHAVELFNASRFRSGEGKMTVSTGIAFVAMCSDLHSKTPAVTPPGATLQVNTAPPGGIFNADTFGDNLSSIRFL
ncbi:MAG TPA: hypothetical protein VF266_09845 [Thermoanaerobaculia bacterium]